ncbi:MAG: response regulator [Pirellulales bacterium]
MPDQPKILLAEEDATLAQITSFRLELLGYRVECVESAAALFDSVARELPGVIILDMYLPDSSGYVVTQRLSSEERTSRVPIMAFSSSGDLDDVERAFTAGAKEFVVTPYDPAVLQRKLQALLEPVL